MLPAVLSLAETKPAITTTAPGTSNGSGTQTIVPEHGGPHGPGRAIMARVPTEEFSHSFAVAAPAGRVYAHLAEPKNYIGLSPLLVAVRDVRRDGGTVSYVAVERFTVGPVRHDNLIAVTMSFPQPGRRLVSDVVSPGRVRLTATVDLVPDGDGTMVTETVRVTFPALLRRFVLGQARKVQRARAAELSRRMATG